MSDRRGACRGDVARDVARVSGAGAGGEAAVSGQTAARFADSRRRWPAQPAGGPDAAPAADALASCGAPARAWADYGALRPRARHRDVSGALSTGRAAQARPDRGVGRADRDVPLCRHSGPGGARPGDAQTAAAFRRRLSTALAVAGPPAGAAGRACLGGVGADQTRGVSAESARSRTSPARNPPRPRLAALLSAARAAASRVRSRGWAAIDPHGCGTPRAQHPPARSLAAAGGTATALTRVAGGGLKLREGRRQRLTVRASGERGAWGCLPSRSARPVPPPRPASDATALVRAQRDACSVPETVSAEAQADLRISIAVRLGVGVPSN